MGYESVGFFPSPAPRSMLVRPPPGKQVNSLRAGSCFVRLYEEIGLGLSLNVVCVDFEILHLFISSGHNYFGHHEKPPGRSREVEVRELQCVAGERNRRGQVLWLQKRL